jgi:hypothetical protein
VGKIRLNPDLMWDSKTGDIIFILTKIQTALMTSGGFIAVAAGLGCE